ncbi:MAG TPA: hypothetical protein P5077_02895, partial [bacterium]|nr:hypothetical protein [bacterium]
MKREKRTSPNNLTRQSRPLLVKGEGATMYPFSFSKEKVGMRSSFFILLLFFLACIGCDGDGPLKPGEFEDPAFAKCVE